MEEEAEPQQPPSPPPPPPPPPAEGLGLQFGPIHNELSMPYIFKSLQGVLSKLSVTQLMWFKRSLAQRNKKKVPDQEQLLECDVLDVVDFLIEHFDLGGGVKMAVTTLHLIDLRPQADELQVVCKRVLLRHELREHLLRRHEVVFEGVPRPGEQANLKRIFSDPLVVEGGYRGIFTEHEVLPRLESAYREPFRRVHLNDLLRPPAGDGAAGGEGGAPRVRVGVLSGPPLAGLTFCALKLLLDWSKGVANQDLHFVFYLSLHELRHHVGERMSLMKLLTMFHHGVDNVLPLLVRADCPSALLLEGWEDRRPLLDLDAPPVTDGDQEAPLGAVLASLLRGDLLPHMRLVITCRRSDLVHVPHAYVDRLLEVRGHTPEGRDLYLGRHHERDPALSQRVLEHVGRSATLLHLARVPLFSWLLTYIYERNFRRKPRFGTRPPHQTTLYVHLLMVLMNRFLERYMGSGSDHHRWKDSDKALVLGAARFAWRMTEARRTRFSAADFKEHHLDERALLRLGMLTEALPEWVRGSAGGGAGTGAYVFLHVSLQEFMAALYVYLTFRNDGRNVFEPPLKSSVVSRLVKDRLALDLFRLATERALAAADGHMDLFLRFLYGLALDSTEDHLRGTLLPHRHPALRGMDELLRHLQKKIRETTHPDRLRNLQHCQDEITEMPDD
ncbi:NLR family CARD domain-containing protein 3-like [Clupea harengus]|uniref:NLR family CARD domain-containing protein 3-like n=1 Tax=Clupea harengus TaxID=7950 RepID=A0A8M1KN27_CLUHA|nr:NLR family CARD domain-containing protein 3-like [Clupea harengus]